MSLQRQKILMCAPEYFGVSYVINPWMQDQIGKVDRELAQKQWNNLRDNLAKYADLVFVAPQPGLPDMVFTANAGMVLDDTVIISHFLSKERKGEEVHFHRWFKDNGFSFADWPSEMSFEGAGDALLDRGERRIWVGHGFRSDATASKLIENIIWRQAVALKLVDPRFYHLDTCFCPLAGGYVMYYPPAFDAESQKIIAGLVPERLRIVVEDGDAMQFACNAVDLDGHVFMNYASDALQNKLQQAGFKAVLTPLSEFLKAGGGAKCLILKLVEE